MKPRKRMFLSIFMICMSISLLMLSFAVVIRKIPTKPNIPIARDEGRLVYDKKISDAYGNEVNFGTFQQDVDLAVFSKSGSPTCIYLAASKYSGWVDAIDVMVAKYEDRGSYAIDRWVVSLKDIYSCLRDVYIVDKPRIAVDSQNTRVYVAGRYLNADSKVQIFCVMLDAATGTLLRYEGGWNTNWNALQDSGNDVAIGPVGRYTTEVYLTGGTLHETTNIGISFVVKFSPPRIAENWHMYIGDPYAAGRDDYDRGGSAITYSYGKLYVTGLAEYGKSYVTKIDATSGNTTDWIKYPNGSYSFNGIACDSTYVYVVSEKYPNSTTSDIICRASLLTYKKSNRPPVGTETIIGSDFASGRAVAVFPFYPGGAAWTGHNNARLFIKTPTWEITETESNYDDRAVGKAIAIDINGNIYIAKSLTRSENHELYLEKYKTVKVITLPPPTSSRRR